MPIQVTLVLIGTGALIAVVMRFAWPRLRRMIHVKLAAVIAEVSERRDHDISVALARQATSDSAAFVSERMSETGKPFPDKFSLLEASLAITEPKEGGAILRIRSLSRYHPELYCREDHVGSPWLRFLRKPAKRLAFGF